MKNKFLILYKFLIIFFISSTLLAENLKIESSEVKIDKKILILFLKEKSKRQMKKIIA